MKFIISVTSILLITLFIIPNISSAQSDVLENLEIEAINVDLEVPDIEQEFENYLDVKETFLNEQTTTNKQSYDTAAVRFAGLIIQSQIDFINKQEKELFALVNPTEQIPVQWLQSEREELENIKNQLTTANDYASARNIINDASEIWQEVDRKIKQIRVWIVYSDFINLLEQANDLRNNVQDSQQMVISNMIEEEKMVWDDWQLVFDTYSEKLASIEEQLNELIGNFNNLKDWTTLDEEDKLWSAAKTELQNLVTESESMKILQAQAISDFYQVMDLLVIPENQELN